MIVTASMQQLGENLLKQIIKNEIVQIAPDLKQDGKLEFKLIVLSTVYKADVPLDQATPETAQRVWTELISTFLADLNIGLNAKNMAEKMAKNASPK